VRLLALLAATLLLIQTDVARADERTVAREHYSKGTKAFDLGLYDDAIREYMAAYQVIDDPALLYNIAQAHRLAGHSADALRFYRVYLAKSTNADNRDEVQTKIEELQKLVDQERKTQSLPPAGAKQPTRTAEPAPASTSSAAPTAATVESAPSGRGKQIAGIAVGAAGVALVATGIAFGVLAKKTGDELTADDVAMRPFDPSKESRGQTDQIVEGVTLAIGGAAVVTGVVLIVLAQRSRHSTRALAWSF
jgi:tetratricopeptide (TPR) repeat protein